VTEHEGEGLDALSVAFPSAIASVGIHGNGVVDLLAAPLRASSPNSVQGGK
jgi:hypothetical protein